MSPFLQAVKTEMAVRRHYIEPPNTLYMGGGTPSLYAAHELCSLIDESKKLWGCECKEITVELNPEDVTLDYCHTLAKGGVNRLSLGIQSFYDDHLRFMNRRHSASQAIRAVEAARDAGFYNLNIDLIFGFPGLLESQWRHNIEQAIALGTEHISAYQLGIEQGTPFDKMVRQGSMQPVSQEVASAQYALLQQLLLDAGWEQYEVSNFARKGYRAVHNSAYWQGVSYLGVGPAAHSFNGVARHANVRHLGRYLKGISLGQLVCKEERITPRKRYNEFVMTRLRCVEGFSREALYQHIFDPNLRLHFEEAATGLLQRGFLVERDGRIAIPPAKWFVSDGIIRELFA